MKAVAAAAVVVVVIVVVVGLYSSSILQLAQNHAILTAMFWVLVFFVRTVDDVIAPAMPFDTERTCSGGVTRVGSSGTLPLQRGRPSAFHVVHHDT